MTNRATRDPDYRQLQVEGSKMKVFYAMRNYTYIADLATGVVRRGTIRISGDTCYSANMIGVGAERSSYQESNLVALRKAMAGNQQNK